MLLNISMMKGEAPRIKSHLLPNETATSAIDCEFEQGIVAPLKKNRLEQTLPDSTNGSLFRYADSVWLTFPVHVDVANNPMAQDEWKRIYWTGEGKPRLTASDITGGSGRVDAWYHLGVPAPDVSPIVINVDNSTGIEPPEGELDSYDDEDRIYVQTYVTRFGEEGAPSDSSTSVVILKPGATVTIDLAQPNTNTHNITHTRLYRSVTSDGEATMMLVAELPISQQTYIDSAQTINNAVLETYDYSPPDENMLGFCVMANGICAGFAGNEVMFSEAFLPYAWPETYRSTTEHEIVGIAPIDTDLVVVTKGYPYLFSGVSPESINGARMGIEQACVSKESLTVINGSAIYASPDGLVSIGRNGISLITEAIITRDQWQTFQPETIKAWSVEGKYVAQSDAGPFIFDPVSQSLTRLTDTWDCAFNDLTQDALFLVQGDQLVQWKGDSIDKSMVWRSKEFLIPKDTFLTSARIQATAPENLTVKLLSDGVEFFTLGNLSDQAFRLPATRSTKIQVEVSGDSAVERILLSNSMEELI
ncbi:hypothetical protein AB6E53_02240 [Vibrio breoganii]|uniref:Uncharacterized protein n=1 Tax=Vibrio breoganii TaxID=553239 RepID=A0AAP8MX75_9VIBR|nr:hypothetical protein [Vibrio breoganii]PMP10206.1 hypothetical protein BCS93_11060 [Vibrio breoganii]